MTNVNNEPAQRAPCKTPVKKIEQNSSRSLVSLVLATPVVSMQHKVATNKHKFLFSSRLATSYLCVTIKIHNVLHQLTQRHEASLMFLSAVVFNPNALASSGFLATHVFPFYPTPSGRNTCRDLLNSSSPRSVVFAFLPICLPR